MPADLFLSRPLIIIAVLFPIDLAFGVCGVRREPTSSESRACPTNLQLSSVHERQQDHGGASQIQVQFDFGFHQVTWKAL